MKNTLLVGILSGSILIMPMTFGIKKSEAQAAGWGALKGGPQAATVQAPTDSTKLPKYPGAPGTTMPASDTVVEDVTIETAIDDLASVDQVKNFLKRYVVDIIQKVARDAALTHSVTVLESGIAALSAQMSALETRVNKACK